MVESGKGLDLTVFEGVLLSVSQSVKELSVLASFDDAVLVPIGRHEEALSHRFAGSEVSNRGDLSGSTRIDRCVIGRQVAAFSWFEGKELANEIVTSDHDRSEYKPGVNNCGRVVEEIFAN